MTSIYHFWSLSGNTTTIEGWEKDKAATLLRRGKIREVKFPYVSKHPLQLFQAQTDMLQNLGTRRNIEAVLGRDPIWWCWPTVPPGTGMRYPLAEGHSEWIELYRSGNGGPRDVYAHADHFEEP